MSEEGGSGDQSLEKFFQSLGQKVEFLSKIKLRGGIVGKVTLLLMIFAISSASISWAIKDIWLGRLTVCLIFILIVYLVPKLIKFAQDHPQAALMEGAEFLLHEQFERMGMKSQPVLRLDPKESTSEPLQHPESDRPEIVEKPDVELDRIGTPGLLAPIQGPASPPTHPGQEMTSDSGSLEDEAEGKRSK